MFSKEDVLRRLTGNQQEKPCFRYGWNLCKFRRNAASVIAAARVTATVSARLRGERQIEYTTPFALYAVSPLLMPFVCLRKRRKGEKRDPQQ